MYAFTRASSSTHHQSEAAYADTFVHNLAAVCDSNLYLALLDNKHCNEGSVSSTVYSATAIRMLELHKTHQYTVSNMLLLPRAHAVCCA
jgi:hypothetical protein